LNTTLSFITPILNSLYQRMICTKFHWYWRAGSGVLKNVIVFLLFRYYLPFEKGIFIYLNNLNPPHLRMICANLQLVTIDPAILEKSKM
jgi:hypothetical protein